MSHALRPLLRVRREPGYWLGVAVDLTGSFFLPPGACASAVLLLVGHSLGLMPHLDRLARALAHAAA